jgi:tetratricopeptide (TPR) repeat protein
MDEPDSEAGESSTESKSRSQRFKITPEQRRFFGGARSHAEPQPPKQQPSKSTPVQAAPPVAGPLPERKPPRRGKRWRISAPAEMQKIVLILGALMLLGGTFYVGKKYAYWKYLLATRKDAEMVAKLTSEFPGTTAEELVENAIVAERLGKWDEAAKRFIAAKYKNPALSGVLFRAAKLCYDHADFDSADRLFESSIGFGENLDGANYYRGMIASARSDFPAAERFYEAAANADPFNADYYYSLAETLRKDHRPKDAIARYEQAARRGGGKAEQTICRFKIRMAKLEAGDSSEVSQEVEQMRSQGPLPVDWIMTAAAIEIQQGHVEQSIPFIHEAHEADQSHLYALFAACVSDRFFSVACQNNPELQRACAVDRAKNPAAAASEKVLQPPP